MEEIKEYEWKLEAKIMYKVIAPTKEEAQKKLEVHCANGDINPTLKFFTDMKVTKVKPQ